MAVLGRLLVSSAERLDLPDLLSLDSYAAGDWKYFLKGLVGDSKPYILKGFDVIDPTNAIGTQSCSVRVADSMVFYPGSNAGGFFHGLAEGNAQSTPLVPELRKNAVNYVYLTFSTFNTSVDTRAFWDPDKDGGAGGEFTQDVNTESVLKVDINVSTGSFPANTIPIAKITVGPVVITAIEDARDLMFRLGNGGINPNPFNQYNWRSLPGGQYQRSEPPTQMLAGGVNPFQGADKNILTLKEWMDAIMSKVRELGGTTYWYDDTSSYSLISNFIDSVATAFKSKGKWVHDSSSAGLLTWTEDLNIKIANDPRTYIIRQGNKTLTDEQVLYLSMSRNLPLNPTDESVQWVNGQAYVNTIGGAVGLFANLTKGDWVKKANDTADKWLRVEEFYDAVSLGGSVTTPALARSIRLSGNYLGVTLSEKGRFDKGVYLNSDVLVSDRNQAAVANTGGNFHWLAMRSDTIENISNIVPTVLSIAISEHDGKTAKVTSTGSHGLNDGDKVTIRGTTNFNNTYSVEVESSTVFYITVAGGPFANESGTARYATVTTSARSTPYGLQLESANHNFKTNDTVVIAGTTNFNGSYSVSVVDATSFRIPISTTVASETVGTATLPRVIVKTDGAVAQIVQGQSAEIGGSAADNIRQYIGMQSLSETNPFYSIPASYNTLDGMQNYNGVVNENLTARVAKLTAMMADKAQDKTIKILPSSGITTITNTQSGSAQLLSFNPSGSFITIATPGSTGNTTVALPSSGSPISLLVNQTAYVSIDRNTAGSASIVIANTVDVPVDENVFVIAMRLSSNDVYTWDARIVPTGTIPFGPGLSSVKLVGGGTFTNISSGSTVIANNATFDSVGNVVAGASGTTPIGQSFQVSASGNINNIKIPLLKNGTPTGTFTMSLYNTTLVLGSYQPSGSPIATSTTTVNASTVPLTFTDYNFAFNSVPVVSGNRYAWVIDNTNITSASVSNAIRCRLNSTSVVAGNTFSGTSVYPSVNSWTSFSNDFVFEVQSASSVSLTFTEDMYLEKSGLAYSDNRILASASPIVFPATQNVAYVVPNLSAGGPNLTVVVDTLVNVPINAIMIARREGSDIIVGSSSMRLIVGESKKLYAGSSDQTLAYTGQPNAADSTPTYTNITNGLAPYAVSQGDNLTQAIGQTIGNVNNILVALDNPSYDEFREIVLSGPTGNQLLAPITSGTIINLPVNSRLSGSPQQFYTVGKGTLEIYLNGQMLQLGEAGGWSEVGTSGTASSQIQINQDLRDTDFLSFRIDATGGPGSGGAGAPDDDFNTLPIKATASNLDYIPVFDVAGNAYKKQTRAAFLAGLNNLVNVRNVTADWTIIDSDDLIVADTTSTLINLTLPSSVLNPGKKYMIKKSNNAPNDLVLNAAGGNLIDGSSTFSFNSNGLTNFGSLTLISDGAGNWWIF